MIRTDSSDASAGIPVVEDDQGAYHVYHDPSEGEVSTTVTLALAEVTGRPPEELVAAFGESVDPDALNRLFRSRGESGPSLRDGRVHFAVEGHEVTVHGDGRIEIRP